MMLHLARWKNGCVLILWVSFGFGQSKSTSLVALPKDQKANSPATIEPICVAVIEPEVTVELSTDGRKAMADAVETLLTDNLTKQKGCVLIDRQTLDKVLAEKANGARGLGKTVPDDVARPFRPFWSAGILLCSTVEPADPKDAGTGPVLVTVEAVAAQTGQLLAEIRTVAKWDPKGGMVASLSSEQLDAFWRMVRDNTLRVHRLPLVEVSETQLLSLLPRLQWMADDLSESLRAAVASNCHVALLTPRRPSSTREEHLLRVMGLSVAKKNDSVASLAPTPDARLSVELTENEAKGITFAKTPFTIRLKWLRQGDKSVDCILNGEVGHYEDIRKQAVQWLQRRLAEDRTGPKLSTDEEQVARNQAQVELAAARQLVESFRAVPPTERDIGYGWYLPPRKQELRAAIARRALRASHLDPTNEEAAFLAAITVDSYYFLQGQERSQACHERVILERQRYLDRFPKPVTFDSHIFQVLQSCDLYQAFCDLRNGAGGWGNVKDRDQATRYAELALRPMAQVAMVRIVREKYGQDSLWTIAVLLSETTFAFCPLDDLENQRRWWQDFWAREVAPLKRDDLPMWEYVSLGYHARKKDVAGLRQALAVLGQHGTEACKWLWEGPSSPSRARGYLRKAGDPEWKTWKPPISRPSNVYHPTEAEWNAYASELCPPMPEMWDCSQLPAFPAEKTIRFPEEVMRFGWSMRHMSHQALVHPLCAAEGQLWFSSPGPVKQDMANEQRDFRLYTVDAKSLENGNSEVQANLTLVEWPKLPSNITKDGRAPLPLLVLCAAADQGPHGDRVWIGTHHHGLACFQRVDGKWRGRWYNAEAGLPAPSIVHIAPCLYDGQKRILLIARLGDSPELREGVHLVVLAPDTGQATILPRAIEPGHFGDLRSVAAVWPNGPSVPVMLYHRDLWPNLDLKNVKEYVDFAMVTGRQLWVSDGDNRNKQPKVWLASDAGIGELDPNGLTPTSWQLKRRELSDFVSYDDQTPFLASRTFLHASWRHFSTPVVGGSICSAGGDNLAWGKFPDLQWYASDGLVAYRMPTAEQGEWIRNDRWYGPLRCPDGNKVAALMPASRGKLYVLSDRGVMYLVSCDQFMAAAEREKKACTTFQWQEDYQRKLRQSGWLYVLRNQISEQQWQEALSTLAAVQDRKNEDKVLFYRALVFARMGKHELDAAAIYAQIIDSKTSCPVAKLFAMVNRIKMLHLAGRWQEMLDDADRLCRMFPDQRPHGNPVDLLDWYVGDARAKMTAEKKIVPAASQERIDAKE
jgi:hypothetical protein